MCKHKSKIRTGQIWRSKDKNYCILVGAKTKDDYWHVYPHGTKNRCHKMSEHSFHFYELVEK